MTLAPLRRSVLVLIILAASICLMWQLAAKSLWIDELVTTEIVRQPTAAAVIAAVKATEGRPPFYYLSAHYWIGLAGHSDWSLRFFSVWATVLCLPLFYGLACRLALRAARVVLAISEATKADLARLVQAWQMSNW
jgi:4-amino-4-deoxy-L-arabinose transferase-like glycosyltransferase